MAGVQEDSTKTKKRSENRSSFFLSLLQDFHFVQKMASSCQLVNHEQSKADVERNVTTDFRVVKHIAHGTFPYTVEVHTNQVAFGIEHRRTGVTTTGMVGGNESYRYRTVHFPLTIILGCMQVAKLLRYVIVVGWCHRKGQS